MLGVNVRSDMRGLLRKFDLSAEDAKRALPRALNKVATTVRKEAAGEIRKLGYGLKIGVIKDALSIRQANLARSNAAVNAKGRPIALYEYGARQRKDGVSVEVKNGRKVITGAFLATMPKTGKRGVFVRVGSAAHARAVKHGFVKAHSGQGTSKGRHGLPIRQLYGPSIPGVFVNEALQVTLAELARARFATVYAQELNYIRTQAATH